MFEPPSHPMIRSSLRRHWQFRISTLLIAVTMVAVLLGTYMYLTVPFRGGQKVSTSLVDCSSRRFSLRLVNKTDEQVFYHLFASRIAAVVTWPPTETWETFLAPKQMIQFSVEEIEGYEKRGNEVTLSMWLIDRSSGAPVVRNRETVCFVP